ncbi:hypothetical protein GCM10010468_71580 [Actinocorallia longicatena]|uniref:Uncharacterized protein n=2 Tax=Actinocorallia longicatena TaxID=111803 RepID=A0ABP6QK16_9ACTN
MARRVRRGPTLLLSDVPGRERLLDTVRLFAPEARVDGGVVWAGDSGLHGPVEVTPKLLRQARLPGGWPVLYVSSGDEGLVGGLAHRLGGIVFAGGRVLPGRDADHHLVTVYLARRPDPGRFSELVSPYAGGVTHTGVPGMDLYSGGRISALVRAVEGAAPPAVGAGAWELTCDLSETAADPAGAHRLALEVGRTALVIAAEFDGVPLDCDGYRITEPRDLLPASLTV